MQEVPPPLPPLNPYAAPVAVVDDVPTGDFVLAERGMRLLAAILDGIALAVPIFVFGMIGAIAIPAMGSSSDVAGTVLVIILVAAFLSVLIVNMVLLHRYGQTIGKRLLGMKVVRTDGSRCGLARIVFARWLPVTVLGAIPLLGYVSFLVDSLMIFRDDQRCLHDLIADTIVVKA